ncbi:TonB-dependent receptor [Stakelama marina]|uniref:TonB-dependent receptor n=1 Tax=Stakelama marina TaxID=2826939 RepID=A0A8T4IMP4_9SPHN|nr:TonB-dependent receptor [Stakelama marina]MBR0553599.1 TonB-dependent receptor [Stakelama marina]
MRSFSARSFSHLVLGASALAIAATPGIALAQDAGSTAGQTSNSNNQGQSDNTATDQAAAGNEIVVTGIRASLRESMNLKRNAQGVIDAISAEDIGKFPDTNLAESLQRITGVSIDRSNGEGSTVTVRGFGPEFNLVLLNGREMPTSSLGDGASPPSSRSFDFANLASEGIAAVEVYKSGRASLPTGGIGSTINILTPRPLDRPGFQGSLAAKAVLDTSRNSGSPITPEFSGIVSDTFGDGKFGILISGAYQKRLASTNTANVDWRDGYLGSENNWGSLPQQGDPRYANITNRPGPNDVYAVPQSASYNLNDIDRVRINGQLVLQFRPIDSLTATVDYTYSQNTVEVRNSNVGIWFNFNDVSSEWTDGPVAGPVFYSEHFGANERKDLSYSGALTANRSINKSLGGNLKWEAPGGVTVQLDAHHSTAESKPTNNYGTSSSVGNAVFGIDNQTINFDNYMPVLSYQMYPGVDPLDPANITPTGNSFRNAYFRDEINQVQLKGHYDHDGSFLDSLDFGVSYVENRVRSAYGYIQNETWSGAGPASDIPDDIFKQVSLPDKFAGLSGSDDPNMIQSFYTFDFPRMVDLIENLYQTCSNPGTGSAQPGTCLANYTVDRRITEKTLAPYMQINNKFYLFDNPAHLNLGLRYEHTNIDSGALVPIPNGASWDAANEFYVQYSGDSNFTAFKGAYQNWLPAIDFDMEPVQDVKLRASYSHTIARADYASLQGGLTLDTQFRVGGGTGGNGNPGLLPYKSKNIDLSAEWYYGPSSYLSVGYFHKDVSNFISSARVDMTAFGLRTPYQGPRYQAAIAALGANAGAQDIRQYIFDNYPGSTQPTGTDPAGYTTGKIFALPEDPLVNFQISQPVNSDQTAKLSGWEFAVQHSFWDTGFGVILNYTIVNGDATFDNTQPYNVTQFALTGLSDSANAVAFYDKGPLQARVAYNWRDQFLAGTGPNPYYVEAYGQVDANASYEFMPGLRAFVEVINLTGESRRGHRRSDRTVTFASPGYARYSGGIRFNF